MRFCHFVAAALFAGPAGAGALAKLESTGAVTCLPALPFFCDNIHVGCAGRTTLRTFAFTLRMNAGRAWVDADADTAGISEQYENARLDWDQDGVIFRPRATQGYIKLLDNGRYSFRHYARDLGTMSHGRCH